MNASRSTRKARTGAENRDGVLHYFHLTDLVKGRGLLKVSVYRGGPRDFYASSIAEFDRRIDTVLLNTIRRRFDSGELTFDVPEGATYLQGSLGDTRRLSTAVASE